MEAEPSLLVERVAASGRLSAAEVRARLAMQAGPGAKAEAFRRLHPQRPIVRIVNNGSPQQLRDRVTALWRQVPTG